MGRLEEEVFEEFFKQLEADATVPSGLIKRISKVLATSRGPREDALKQMIEEEVKDAD